MAMIGHTGYEVWCDSCRIALGASIHTVHDSKRDAWKAAKASGWAYVVSVTKLAKSTRKVLHYCPKCATKKKHTNGHGIKPMG